MKEQNYRLNIDTSKSRLADEMKTLEERAKMRHDGLEIALVESATPLDIRDLATNNNVYRSAHIGNVAPANLVSGALGARYILYDRNTPSRDVNYHPGHLIKDGSNHIIGNHNLFDAFSPFVPFATDIDRQLIGDSKSPAEHHLSATSRLFPDRVETQSEYLNRYREKLERAVQALGSLQTVSELFDRSLDSSGIGFKRPQGYYRNISNDFFDTNQAFIDAVRGGVEKAEFPKNPVVCSLLFITLSFILAEASEKYQKSGDEIAVIYHLAGPDMGNYVTQQKDRLGFLLGVVRKSGEIKLPRKILFAVIPTAHLRLVSTGVKNGELDNLLLALGMQKKANALKKNGGDIEKVVSMKTEAKRLARGAINSLDIDLKNKLSMHFSQHDLDGLSDLYIPSRVMEMDKEETRKSFEQLAHMIG